MHSAPGPRELHITSLYTMFHFSVIRTRIVFSQVSLTILRRYSHQKPTGLGPSGSSFEPAKKLKGPTRTVTASPRTKDVTPELKPARGSIEALITALEQYFTDFKYKQRPLMKLFERRYSSELQWFMYNNKREFAKKWKARQDCLEQLASQKKFNSRAVATALWKATRCALDCQLRSIEPFINFDKISRFKKARRPETATELRSTRLQAELTSHQVKQDLTKWWDTVAQAQRSKRARSRTR